jgi:hypothetical protein
MMQDVFTSTESAILHARGTEYRIIISTSLSTKVRRYQRDNQKKKDRQCNDQWTNNSRQNTTQKHTIGKYEPHKKTGDELVFSEMISSSLVAPAMFLLLNIV